MAGEGEKHKDCPLVIIHWVDSRRPTSEWQRLSDVDEPSVVSCVSVGWMLYDNADCKVLCPNMGDLDSDQAQGSGIIEIPVSCITSVEPLVEEVISSSVS